jgi:GH15 family glucan-1,4-alpha-glucosidase
MSSKPLRIEDYALIGDCETAALVGTDGSIDWLCWPNFASGACFAKLLGTDDNGFWKIAPAGAIQKATRQYWDHTLILETRFVTDAGEVALIDFMPPRGRFSDVVRIVRGIRGAVELTSALSLRFNYGSAVPWVTKIDGGIRAVAGPDIVVLRTPVETHGEAMQTVGNFPVSEGQSIPFVLTYGAYGDYQHPDPPAIDAERALEETAEFWKKWASHSPYDGKHREAVERSLLTLKALTYRPTGGVVAAPTMALPEQIGGPRNWDYRYCWLRDTTFTLLALMNGGYFHEAEAWMNWLLRTIAGSPDQVQIMYGIQGERTLIEWEVPWLPGYEDSKPVRVGNAASNQVQLDIYGEVLDAFYQAQGKINAEREADFDLIRGLIDHLQTIWQQPDEGIWETRGGPKHFVYSKAMAWVAFDRAIRLAEGWGFDGHDDPDSAAQISKWKETRDAIHRQVCEKGFSQKLNSFTQSYGSEELDAATLLLALLGFLPPSDPRIVGTVEAIEKHLTHDGFVLRYNTATSRDGLPAGEGAFLACSFWLVSNLALIGRKDDATALFNRLLALRNDLGLLSEEYDVQRKRLVGNFPQAFSHISLIGAAHTLEGHGLLRRHLAGSLHSAREVSQDARLVK